MFVKIAERRVGDQGAFWLLANLHSFTRKIGSDSHKDDTNVTEGSTTLYSQVRTYDNAGNVLGLATTTLAQSGSSVTENESFCYDALNRLIWAGNINDVELLMTSKNKLASSSLLYRRGRYKYDAVRHEIADLFTGSLNESTGLQRCIGCDPPQYHARRRVISKSG